jgi:hypothetical protein
VRDALQLYPKNVILMVSKHAPRKHFAANDGMCGNTNNTVLRAAVLGSALMIFGEASIVMSVLPAAKAPTAVHEKHKALLRYDSKNAHAHVPGVKILPDAPAINKTITAAKTQKKQSEMENRERH